MKYKALLFFVCLVQSFFAYTQTDKASELMMQFRYREALEVLENVPETIESQSQKAECHQKLYDYAAAMRIYETLSQTDSDNLSFAIAAAECASQWGDADLSLKYWLKACDISPDNLFLETKKTMAFYRVGEWKKTIENIDAVLAKDSVPLLLRMAGDAYLNLQDPVMANYFFTKAIDKNPSDYIALSRICEFYYGLGDIGYDTVVVMTDKYLKNINENQKTIGQFNGMANYSLGNYKKSIERLNKNLELGDSTYTTVYFLGMSYYGSKLYFDAAKWLEKAYNIKKDRDINLLFYYGSALARTYDRKRGIEVLLEGVDKINKLNDMLFDFDMSLADAYLRSNAPSQAITYYNSALKRRPKTSPILYNIAHAYERMNDYENALSYYRQFLKTAPKGMALNDEPVDKEDLENISSTEAYYRAAYARVKELQEMLFLKKGSSK